MTSKNRRLDNKEFEGKVAKRHAYNPANTGEVFAACGTSQHSFLTMTSVNRRKHGAEGAITKRESIKFRLTTGFWKSAGNSSPTPSNLRKIYSPILDHVPPDSVHSLMCDSCLCCCAFT
ncbi:hypothetical protein X797_003536 [Metarhizium robertsii]|uniref:Uncharacterized protein n=1 Tax=Metarhizium robertsii TaxID=568076 RepID=A0A0A1V0C4_9HYPO|nr:hypothetical protein X797_003536 [Metarhizium robertsii]